MTTTSTAFAELYGHAPEGVWAAPGRVNLIGEHTDYNDGFVLPIALPQTVRVQGRRRSDTLLRLHSSRTPGEVVELDVAELAPGRVKGWAAYPAAVVWTLRQAGHPVGGADLTFDSDVPAGAGLSSSAALECAVAIAYDGLYGLGLDARRLALLAQRAENEFVGVPCGIMDQMASMACRAAPPSTWTPATCPPGTSRSTSRAPVWPCSSSTPGCSTTSATAPTRHCGPGASGRPPCSGCRRCATSRWPSSRSPFRNSRRSSARWSATW